MFIDYVTLMLTNMAAGLTILACFLIGPIQSPTRRNWTPAFAIVGLVAVVCGFTMTFTWPLPYPYNIPYGEMSILLGMLFLAAAWTTARDLWYTPLGIYALIAGAAAVLIGIRIIDLNLTNSPALSGIGFILTGAAGICSSLVLCMPKVKLFRYLGALVLLAAAAIWAYTAALAYWSHLAPR
jgi:putative membrane protein